MDLTIDLQPSSEFFFHGLPFNRYPFTFFALKAQEKCLSSFIIDFFLHSFHSDEKP